MPVAYSFVGNFARRFFVRRWDLQARVNYLASLHKRFGNVTVARISQTVTNSGLTVGTGFYGLASTGLISSYLIGQLVAIIPLLGKFIKNDRKLVHEINKSEINIAEIGRIKAIFLDK